MWKRNDQDEAADTTPDSSPPAASRSPAPPTAPTPTTPGESVAKIGQSVVVKGELTGSENLIIEGTIEGTINLHDHQLTIGPGGQITAQIVAKAVVVLGRVEGNITATERIDIRENGSVDGDLTAPRVSIAEGSHFRGSIDMKKTRKTDSGGATTSGRAGHEGDGEARAAAPSGPATRARR